jgi:hypothetical protein
MAVTAMHGNTPSNGKEPFGTAIYGISACVAMYDRSMAAKLGD